jgi:hypothetical protein
MDKKISQHHLLFLEVQNHLNDSSRTLWYQIWSFYHQIPTNHFFSWSSTISHDFLFPFSNNLSFLKQLGDWTKLFNCKNKRIKKEIWKYTKAKLSKRCWHHFLSLFFFKRTPIFSLFQFWSPSYLSKDSLCGVKPEFC